MENGKNYQNLNTNLQPSFWRKVQTIIRQNKKAALIHFLFPISELEVSKNSEDQIENIKKIENFELLLKSLQDQIYSLKERVIYLENQIIVKEKDTKVPSDDSKIGQKAPLKVERGDSSFKEYSDVSDLSNSSLQEYQRPVKSESLSKGFQTPVKEFPSTEHYNLSSTQDKDPNEPNFITVGNLSEQEKIEIIKRGFQLNQEDKISLKKYYQSTEKYSLFQFKGYNIKYESVRRTKIYLKLKEES